MTLLKEPLQEPGAAAAPPDPELLIKEARRRHRRRLTAVSVVVLALVAAGIAVVGFTGHGSSSTYRAPLSKRPTARRAVTYSPCVPSRLRLAVINRGVGTGTRTITGLLTNSGPSTCTIAGYPAVSLFGSNGQALQVTERHNSTVTYYYFSSGSGGYAPKSYPRSPRIVTLREGQNASFAISMYDGNGAAPVTPLPSCPAISAVGVAPPTSHEPDGVVLTQQVAQVGEPTRAYPDQQGAPCGVIDVSFIVFDGRPPPPPRPAVRQVIPSEGSTGGGTTVTGTGTFSHVESVHFGKASVPFVVTATGTLPTGTITATAPAESAGVVNVTVTTSNGTSAVVGPDEFVYLSPPPPQRTR